MKMNSMCIELADEDFRKEVLESDRLVVVEFLANWSGLCQILAPVIEEMALKFRTRVKFCIIDMDDGGEVAKAYGIGKIPTILFFKGGQVVDHIVGAVPKTKIAHKLDALLQL